MPNMSYTMKTCDELESDFLSYFQKLRTLMGGYDIDNLAWIMKQHKNIIKHAKLGTLPHIDDFDDFSSVLAEAAHHSLFHDDIIMEPKMKILYEQLRSIHYAMEQACVPANAEKIAQAKATATAEAAAIATKRNATIAARKSEKQIALMAAAAKIAADEAAGITRRTRNSTY